MNDKNPAAERLVRAQNSLKWWCDLYWLALGVNSVLLFCYLFWAMTASKFDHTYFLPAGAPGTLTSQRWSADFVATGSLAALSFLILGGAWVVSHPMGKWSVRTHLIMLLLAFVYYTVVLSAIWSFPLAKANVAVIGNAQNGANDDRYCCVNPGLGGCPNSNNPSASPALSAYGCSLGVGQADLIPNGVFLWKFCGLIIALVFMLVDGMYMMLVLRPAIYECNEAIAAMLPQPQPSAPPLDETDGGGGGEIIVTQGQQQQQQYRSSARIAKPVLKATFALPARDPHGIIPRLSGHGRK
jgi:hypothetical protein